MGNGRHVDAPKRGLALRSIAHQTPGDRALSTGYGAISVARKSLTLVRVGPVIRLSPNRSKKA